MSTNPFNRILSDVTDPTDWKDTKVPDLAVLDSLERCYICKEFFRAPVLTSCNHTFCSQCIREYLISNNLCPLCKTELFESSLKRDILLEEIVACYSSIRPRLLELLKTEKNSNNDNNEKKEESGSVEKANISEQSTSNTEVCYSPQQNLINDSHKRSSHRDNEEVIEVLSDDERERVSTSSSSPELLGEPAMKKVKIESSHNETLDAIPGREDLVTCPICSTSMSAEELQTRHIDDCLNGRITSRSKPQQLQKKRPSPRAGIASFFKKKDTSPLGTSSISSVSRGAQPLGHSDFYFKEVEKHVTETKKLSKLDFASLTTPRLKEKLAAFKLPIQGTRNQLELRYNQYYVLYNSNLDSNHPVSDKILKHKLNQWEKSHSAFNSESANLFSSRGTISNRSITAKNFSVKEWLDVYQDEFRELIRTARASVAKERKERKKEQAPREEVVETEPTVFKPDAVSPASTPQEIGSTKSVDGGTSSDLTFELDMGSSMLFDSNDTT
ncbi:Postreplication repair E3 ubiquitin-protein ligase RAD18 [Scheffersomyces xylosifermentans]|uniref:Postreplication repair E3 ubiquitin-protein ligase RAD18 n=1 Tax=Scheffersomyces xylosifermentans TaxID=1304137 RepID=UPI00315DF4F9